MQQDGCGLGPGCGARQALAAKPWQPRRQLACKAARRGQRAAGGGGWKGGGAAAAAFLVPVSCTPSHQRAHSFSCCSAHLPSSSPQLYALCCRPQSATECTDTPCGPRQQQQTPHEAAAAPRAFERGVRLQLEPCRCRQPGRRAGNAGAVFPGQGGALQGLLSFSAADRLVAGCGCDQQDARALAMHAGGWRFAPVHCRCRPPPPLSPPPCPPAASPQVGRGSYAQAFEVTDLRTGERLCAKKLSKFKHNMLPQQAAAAVAAEAETLVRAAAGQRGVSRCPACCAPARAAAAPGSACCIPGCGQAGGQGRT